MARRCFIPVLALFAVAGSLALWSMAKDPEEVLDQPQIRESVKVFMRPKLAHAQNVLEGLSLEQYEVISREAQALSLLSREAEWQVLQTAEYLHFSGEFRRAADAMHAAAEKKNLDAATLAYISMTLKCVECHKYVRDIRTASAPVRAPDEIAEIRP